MTSLGAPASTRRAASAAPADDGASPVSKMNGRPTSTSVPRISGAASTAPPWAPRAFDSVIVRTTSGSPASPAACTAPRPPLPSTPSACASSTTSSPPCRRVALCSPPSGARSPSTLNSASVTTSACGSIRPASARSIAATSRCGLTTTRDRDSRQASTIDAWLAASETTNTSGPPSVAITARLARYPDENTSAPGDEVNAASATSRSECSVVVPVTSRDPVEPAPQVSAAAAAADATRGSRARPR